jgi:uncharacterized protein YcbK (DUF882 family)
VRTIVGTGAGQDPLGPPAALRPHGPRLPRDPARRGTLTLLAVAAAWIGGTQATQDAVANGDTRTLTIYHAHTRESASVTYRRNGAYDERALEQLNWLLRDWRRDEPTRMDPRLFDTLWEVYRETGSEEAVHVVSAYRSPATNAMLRRRSRAVAEHSQHMLGKAMDFHLPDVPADRVRAIGMRLQNGGVGYYPTAGTPFIHLDVGSVRAWPRMTRDQLARLFPDGRTVHVPADGKPLAGYEEARAEILARGGTVAGLQSMIAEAETGTGKRRGFWATLFGIDEDEDAQEIRATQTRTAASRTRPVALAGAASPGGDESPTAVLMAYNDHQAAARAARAAPASLPRMVPPAPPPEPAATALRTPAARAADEAQAVPAAPAPRPPEEPAAIPVRAAPPAPRPDDPPPPVRVAALSVPAEMPAGPRLAWPSGAPGLAGAAHTLIPPLPPRRPDDVVVTGTLGAPRIQPAAGPASPPGAGIPHPLPPVRPTLRPVQVAAAGPVAVPRPADPVPARTPSPQARPSSASDRAAPNARVANAAPPAPARGSGTARPPAKDAGGGKAARPGAMPAKADARPAAAARPGPTPAKAEERAAVRVGAAAAKPRTAAR